MNRNFTRRILSITVVAVMALGSSRAMAQGREITGSVKNAQGEPIAGAIVTAGGASKGATTRSNGVYTLKIGEDASQITASHIGYEERSVPLKSSQTVYDFVMNENAQTIEDIVVIGYGASVDKKDLTGAVASVSGKTLEDLPLTNTASALTGRLPGVQVTTTDGAPDAEIKIRVRGGGSVTQDNSPLYIVDGFPVESISNISMNDIESFNILKDASTAAIYGARGANGVFIITTKSAKAGKPEITYNGFAQMKYVPKMIDMMDPYEFVLLQYELTSLKGGDEKVGFDTRFGDPEDFDIYKTLPGRNGQKDVYGRTAWGQSHNVSISTGNDKTKFLIGGTYIDEDDVLIRSGQQRSNANFKLNHKFSNKVRLDLSAYYTNRIIKGAGTTTGSSTEIKNAVSYRPVTGKAERGLAEEEYTELVDDYIESNSGLYDPVKLVEQDYKKQRRNEVTVNGAISWSITPKLSLRSDFGIMGRYDQTDRVYGPLTYTARQAGSKPVAEILNNDFSRWRTSHALNYNLKKWRKHHDISATAGFEALRETASLKRLRAQSFPADMSPQDIIANMSFGSQEYPYTFVETPVSMASFFGRANYTYKYKYIATATFRFDGSSKFAPGKQWAFFPSAALAWRMSQEPFLKQVKWVSDLKLRASLGEAGNNRIASDMWRTTCMGQFQGKQGSVAGIGGQPNVSFVPASTILTNANLVWETTTTRNLGLDFGFLKGRISGSAEVYYNTTRNLLMRNTIPYHTGFTEQLVNVGRTSNRGVELSFNAAIVQSKDFNLSASFNIAMNRNRVDKLNMEDKLFNSGWNNTELRDYLLQEGQPVGLMYGYVSDGFYTVDDYKDEPGWKLKDGVYNSQSITGSNGGDGDNPRVGSLKLKKLADDGSMNITLADRTIIGNANPKHTGGFGITANYRNIDLSAFFNWVYGNDVYNAQKIANATTTKTQWHNLRSDMDSHHRFRIYDDAGNDLRGDKDAMRTFNAGANTFSPVMQYNVLHSWAVEDGSFLRLSNVTIGYTFPQKLSRKIYVSRLRVYATGNNLFLWTNYTGFDPEVDTRRTTPLTPGVDYSAYPKTRSFSMGLNVTF